MAFSFRRTSRPINAVVLALATVAGVSLLQISLAPPPAITAASPEAVAPRDSSPVDLLLIDDEKYILSVNSGDDSLSLIRTLDGKTVARVSVGEKPSGIAPSPDGKTILVSSAFGGEVHRIVRDGETLALAAKIRTSFEPRGIAVSPDGKLAYVALATGNAIAVIDMATDKVVDKIECGRWPRQLALSADGKRLAIGVNGDGGVAVVDTATRKLDFVEDFMGLNMGQMQISSDGKRVYFPWMVYRHNPITKNNIQIGWVLASRIARVKIGEKARREAMSLDPRGEAVADPHGIALDSDEKTLVCSAAGTHELLVYSMEALSFQDYGGPGDHIDPSLLNNPQKFRRIPLGGRPMNLRMSRDNRHVYVANALNNSIQVVDIIDSKVVRTIAVGGPPEASAARRGEAIFYDARRSLDQWYSCHSCHFEGHVNAVTMDTRNDGRFGNFKTVLTLRESDKTGPWFWHGTMQDFKGGLRQSMIDTMLGKVPSAADVADLAEFIKTLKHPRNPNRPADGSLTPAAKRGEVVFRSEKASCIDCHKGEQFADSRVREVASGESGDVHKGFSPPSLRNTFDRTKWMHDGRAATLRELLVGPHSPEKVSGNGKLTEAELNDLLAYLNEI